MTLDQDGPRARGHTMTQPTHAEEVAAAVAYGQQLAVRRILDMLANTRWRVTDAHIVDSHGEPLPMRRQMEHGYDLAMSVVKGYKITETPTQEGD